MTLNGIVAGCNQKSNRAPLMQLEPDDVQESLDRLREFGAVGMVEGSAVSPNIGTTSTTGSALKRSSYRS